VEEDAVAVVTPEEEIDAYQRTITACNDVISDRIAVRKAAERKLLDLKRNRDSPVAMVILAARHLDPEEGVMRAGHVVTPADVSAVRTVLRFVSARKECELR
jgi:hypothetical protein